MYPNIRQAAQSVTVSRAIEPEQEMKESLITNRRVYGQQAALDQSGKPCIARMIKDPVALPAAS
jgi:hypothetical protein